MDQSNGVSGQRQTRADNVRERMRADILGGRIKPGERLMFQDVRERYGVSVGVAREALAALVSQGLVTSVAHHGYRVTPITPADLRTLGEARMMIEPLVLADSMKRGGLEWEAQLMSAFHVVSRTPHDDPETGMTAPDWEAAHKAFHRALLGGCGNARLIEITNQFSEEAALYRRWSDAVTTDRDVSSEHAALLEAALSGDTERAADLLRHHIRETVNALIAAEEQSGSVVED